MSILTYNKQQEIKPVSINNKTKFEEIIKETEDLELDKLLGTELYQEIIDNYVPTTTATTVTNKYQDLVEGSTFTDCLGNEIKHKGLWYTLAYLNYASYVEQSYIQDTFTGFVQKQREDSTTISTGAMKNLRDKYREIAFNYFEKTRLYLIENSSLFTNYCIKKEKRNTDKIFFGVRRTIK